MFSQDDRLVPDVGPSGLEQERLAAIVSSSDDVIISKTLEGIITSWNASAARILGFGADEMIGQPITRIIPIELAHEETEIISRIRRGQRVEHFDTERLRKDGTRVALSITVSPLRDRTGRIVGASKVARDITERRKAEDLQRLLFNELNHRVKNTLATIQAIASQSLRRSLDQGEFVSSFNGRLQALARAHDLLVHGGLNDSSISGLMREQVVLGQNDPRIFLAGPEVRLNAETTVEVALLLHELATNARKYGALSSPNGLLDIRWHLSAGTELVIDWRESGLTDVQPPTRVGFGSTLIENALLGRGGATRVDFTPTGLICQIRLPLTAEEQQKLSALRLEGALRPSIAAPRASLTARRVLVIEDEVLIALEIKELLEEAGMTVIGPARTLEMAMTLAQSETFDAALVDANLNGCPVDGIVAILSARRIPFAFCTGYGRDALPSLGRRIPILNKPFGWKELEDVITGLLARRP